MHKLLTLLRIGSGCLLVSVWAAFIPNNTFKKQQFQFPRVRNAFAEKEQVVKTLFATQLANLDKSQLYIRVFKQEGILEVWANNNPQAPFKLIQSYAICAASGTLGPKRKEGDGQVPEGFYYIDRFNPQSQFYLSLGINYPNAADRIRIGKTRPGGDIFIHGACVTVGCMPLTDDKIKELYLMAVEAKSRGQSRIPVHIFPSKLSAHQWEKLKHTYRNDTPLLQFWENLKTGYDWFEVHKRLPLIQVDSQGHYQFIKSLPGNKPSV